MSDNSSSESDLLIESANSSFYEHYKQGVLDFLDFVASVGNDAVATGRLQQSDQAAIERGLHLIDHHQPDLFPLLAKHIDENNPTFFDECTIASLWELMGSIFLIAQHSGFTDSAKVNAKLDAGRHQASIARSSKATKDDKLRPMLEKAIKDEVDSKGLVQAKSISFAESIREGVRARLVQSCKEQKLKIPDAYPSPATIKGAVKARKRKRLVG